MKTKSKAKVPVKKISNVEKHNVVRSIRKQVVAKLGSY